MTKAAFLVLAVLLRAGADASADGGRAGLPPYPAVSGNGNVKEGGEAGDVLECFNGEPDIREVQQAAVEFAGIDASRFSSWEKRAKRSAWLPKLRARLDKNLGEGRTFIIEGGEAPRDALTTDDDVGFELRAEWELGRLAFNPDELRVSEESRDSARMREDVIYEVTRMYFDRRRLQIELLLAPPDKVEVRVEKELRVEEMTSMLDSLTGGRFEGTWKGCKR